MAKRQDPFDPAEFMRDLSQRLKEESRAPNIKKYKPHQRQFEFHSSRKKKKLYIGGNRSGKTTGGITEGIWRATCRHPYRQDLNQLGPTRGRIISNGITEGIEKIIFPQFKQWIYPSIMRGGSWETAYDKVTRVFTFDNGSTVEFMSYDQDLVKHAGTSRHWIHFDEEPPYPIYQENRARLIDTDGDFWITMTPLDGMNWVYDQLYEPNINKPPEEQDVTIIEINSLENPYLSGSAIENFLDGTEEDDVNSRIGGQFITLGGKIYKNFDPTVGGKHVLEEPVLEPKRVFRDCLWIVALDHGFNNPTAVYWIAVDTNGFAVIFDEHYQREWTVDRHAAEIHRRVRLHGRTPDIFVADPSIMGRNGVTGTSIHQEYAKAGIGFIKGNNDVKAGIVRVRKYLQDHKYIKTRGDYPELFPRTSPGEVPTYPMLRIAPNCTNLIGEMKKYRWKTYTNKKLQYENNPYDEPHKKDDHGCDAIRYAIMTQPDLFADIESRANQVENALDTLNLGENSAFKISGGYNDDVATPFGQIDDGIWAEGNDLPNRFGGDDWTIDEHLGGL